MFLASTHNTRPTVHPTGELVGKQYPPGERDLVRNFRFFFWLLVKFFDFTSYICCAFLYAKTNAAPLRLYNLRLLSKFIGSGFLVFARGKVGD